MTTYNPDNGRIKHRYFGFLKEAKRHGEAKLDSVAKALDRFESYTGHRDFKAFRIAVKVTDMLGEEVIVTTVV